MPGGVSDGGDSGLPGCVGAGAGAFGRGAAVFAFGVLHARPLVALALALLLDDACLEGAVTRRGHVRQAHAREHEDAGADRGGARQDVAGAAPAEDLLRRAAAERRAHAAALALLQEHDQHEKEAHRDVDDFENT